MKKLFTIACTLVLGGALGFAQAAAAQRRLRRQATRPQDRHVDHHQEASQTWRQENQEKQEVYRQRLRRQQQAHHPNKLLFIVTQAASCRPLFLRLSKKGFLFQLLCLKCCATILYRVEGFQKLDIPLKETNEEATYNRVYTAAGR